MKREELKVSLEKVKQRFETERAHALNRINEAREEFDGIEETFKEVEDTLGVLETELEDLEITDEQGEAWWAENGSWEHILAFLHHRASSGDIWSDTLKAILPMLLLIKRSDEGEDLIQL